MKLTKTQIDYIENQLIKNGVKYWDIRIELLDHVVSDVENSLENQEDFKKAVQNSFISLGWTSWGKLEKVVRNQTVLVNKQYRKIFLNEFLSFFKSLKNTLIFSSFIGIYMYLFFYLGFNIFNKLSIGILAVMLLITLSKLISFKKKNYRKKSLHFNIVSSKIMALFLAFNFISPFLKKEGFFDLSIVTKKIILILFTSILVVFVFTGLKVYKIIEDKLKRIYNELQKL